MKKDEIKLYRDILEVKNEVTVKICDRIKVKGEEAVEDQVETFIMGTGYEKCKDYRTEGFRYTFILNEFSDLLELIPKDQQHK